MLHATTCLTTPSQHKMHSVTLAVELDSTFSTIAEIFLKPIQVRSRDCNVLSETIASCSLRLKGVNMSPTTCNGFLFPTLRVKLQGKLDRVKATFHLTISMRGSAYNGQNSKG